MMPKLLELGSRRERAVDAGLLALLCAGHLALGALQLPSWIFPKYPDAAALLRSGALTPDAAGDYSPLYLLLNVALPPAPLRWAQSLVGCGGILAVYLLGRHLLGRLSGLFAAALFAAAAPVILYEATLEPDLLICTLHAGALSLLVGAVPDDTAQVGRRLLRRAAGAGALVGLSAALRPAALPLLAGAGVWLVATAWPRAGRRSWLLGGALLACGAGAVLGPALAVRAAVGPELTATMSGGAVLQMGNRPEGTGIGAQPPFLLKMLERQQGRYAAHELYRRFARAAKGDALSPAEAERYWVEKVLAFVRRHPVAYASLLARKLAFFTFGPDAHDLGEVRRAELELRRLPLLGFRELGLLGVAGLAVALWRRRGSLLLTYLSCTALVALLFYVVTRFRLAALPAFCVLGGALGAALVEGFGRRRAWVPAGGGLLLAGALFLGASGVADLARLIARGAEASTRILALEQSRARGELDAATEVFTAMQAAQPFTVLTQDLRGIAFESKSLAEASARWSASHYDVAKGADAYLLAVLAARAGACDRAIAAARAVAAEGFRSAIYDRSLDGELLAAECLREKGDGAAAMVEITRSLARRPGTLDALAAAVALGEARSGLAAPEQLSRWREELFDLHDPMSAHYALARARNGWGDGARALADADAVLTKLPDSALARYERARALLALGRGDEALSEYARALATFPRHAFPTRPFDALVQQKLGAPPWSPELVALAIEHEIRAGRIASARSVAQRAAEGGIPVGGALAAWLSRARSSEAFVER